MATATATARDGDDVERVARGDTAVTAATATMRGPGADEDAHAKRKQAIVAATIAKTMEANERRAAVRARAEARAQAKREELAKAVEAKTRKIEGITGGKGKEEGVAEASADAVTTTTTTTTMATGKSAEGARKSTDSDRRVSLEGRPQWRSPVDGEETTSEAVVGTPANGDSSVKQEVEKIEERVMHDNNGVGENIKTIEVEESESDEDSTSERDGESADENEEPFKTPTKSAPENVFTPTSTPSKSTSKTPSAMKAKLNERLNEAREIAAANARELAASPLRSTFKQRFSAPKEPNAVEKVKASARRLARRIQSRVSALTDKYPKQVAGGVGALALMVLLSQRRGRDVVPVASRKKR